MDGFSYYDKFLALAYLSCLGIPFPSFVTLFNEVGFDKNMPGQNK